MYRLSHLLIFVLLIVSMASLATADYRITNASETETVWAAYAIWRSADNTFPAGWRIKGWYEIDPGGSRKLTVPSQNRWVYIRLERGGREVKPANHATRARASFFIHPSKAFTAVVDDNGNFLKSNLNRRTLKKTHFYRYPNGGSQTIRNVLKQEASLATKVFNKHGKTLAREDIQGVLPSVFESLKDSKTQRFLNPATINLVVSNPELLKQFVPDIDPKFVRMLKRDAKLRSMLRDPEVQTLLQKPAAIDKLAALLGIDAPVQGVRPERDPPAHPNLSDLPAEQIYKQAIHAVVWIHTIEGNQIGKGSGVLIGDSTHTLKRGASVS